MKQEHHGDILGYNLVYPDNGTMGKDCYVKLINGDVIWLSGDSAKKKKNLCVIQHIYEIQYDEMVIQQDSTIFDGLISHVQTNPTINIDHQKIVVLSQLNHWRVFR